jgi:hypothetical protein
MTLHLAFVRRSEPELGRDAHVLSKRCERFAHGLLVDVWATYFRDVEERDATGDCRADERDHPPRRTFAAGERMPLSLRNRSLQSSWKA